MEASPAMVLKDRIQQRLEELGLSAREASKRAGMGEYFVRDLLSGKAKSPKATSLQALAGALETSTEWLLEQRGEMGGLPIPLLYFVGAGAAVMAFDDQAALEYVEAPPGAKDVAGAAIVRGTSQLPVLHDGDVVFWGAASADPSAFIGLECVCTLDDGRQVVKTLLPGSAGGRYTLSAHNEQPMLDVMVSEAAPVLWVKRSLRR